MADAGAPRSHDTQAQRRWSGRRLASVALPALLTLIYGTLSVARRLTEAVRATGLLRLAVGLVFASAGTLVLVLLARDRRARTPRVWAALLLTAGVYAAVVFPMDSPEEKLHFIEYGVVALLAFAAAPEAWSEGKRTLGAALFTVAAGWADEGIQWLLPNRYYDLRDVAFNALAGVFALAAFNAVRRARLSAPPPEAG